MRRAIVADSAGIVHFVLERIIGKEGWQVLYVKHARDLISQVKEIMPDLIFLEPEISGGKGRRVCEYLSRSPETRHIPILLATRITDTARYEMETWPSVKGVIRKPLNSEKVFEAMAALNIADTADFEVLERESDAG